MDDKAIHQREENAKIHFGSVAASKKIDQVETQSYFDATTWRLDLR